jgi:pyruvoyl-dependent arginine decarboxylase (PvlArgDC)
MYSSLNVLVNDINALGVKNITDLNINRKILQSLRKPDYDLVKAIIYEKKLEELKPSHILSKIMAHELQIMPKSKKAPQEKTQEPSSPTTSHALSSQQEKVLSRMDTHGSASEDDGDDEDSSSDEEVESMVAEYVKKIFKYVKKVNMYGYNVHLREGCHHQHIKFTKIEHKPKKKVVKERRPRQEATIVVREWTSGGESSSPSSSDESRKNFTTCFIQGPSSSLTCALWLKVWKAM